MSVPETVRDLIDQQAIVALATAAADGTPNAAPIYWKFWYDDCTLLLLDNYMKTTKANVRTTKRASVSAWDAASGVGFQVKGDAEYLTEGIYMDAAVAHMKSKKPGASPKGVVVLKVSQIFIQTPGENAGELLQ
ncbi:MAG: pyridoxamine 5'-phosphate oxidase family protein [Armatimonadota bacterium]